MKKYYYFGRTTIFCFDTKTEDFEALTKKQSAFYEQCQNEGYSPTLDEVRNCAKTVIPFDLEAYKIWQISQMSMVSLSTAETVFPSYARRNAELQIYSNFSELLENEKALILELRGEFYRMQTAISVAENKAAVDEIVSSAKFEEIANMYDFKGVTNE